MTQRSAVPNLPPADRAQIGAGNDAESRGLDWRDVPRVHGSQPRSLSRNAPSATGRIWLRAAEYRDIPRLVALVDCAASGLLLHMWRDVGPAGANPWDVGRNMMMFERADIYLGNTWIAEADGGGCGVLVAYALPRPKAPCVGPEPAYIAPITELEAEAAGTGHVSYLCTDGAARGGGIGSALLRFAEAFRGPRGMSLIVAGRNRSARALYERFGYADVDRRPFLGADGAPVGDDWILMINPLRGDAASRRGRESPGDDDMIDRSAFDRLRHAMGDDPRDLIELIESFLEEGPRLLAEMEAAAPAGDLALLRRHAHSLKSNARDLGATALAGLCAWFEGDLRDGRDIGDLSGRVAALREEWDRVRAALSDEIVRLGAQP